MRALHLLRCEDTAILNRGRRLERGDCVDDPLRGRCVTSVARKLGKRRVEAERDWLEPGRELAADPCDVVPAPGCEVEVREVSESEPLGVAVADAARELEGLLGEVNRLREVPQADSAGRSCCVRAHRGRGQVVLERELEGVTDERQRGLAAPLLVGEEALPC